MQALLMTSSGRVGCKVSWKDNRTMYVLAASQTVALFKYLVCYPSPVSFHYKYYMLSLPSVSQSQCQARHRHC
jgi:hypothetical protein